MKAFRSSSPAGVALCVAGVALALSAGVNAQVRVDVTNLVTDDQAAHAAQITDGALVNAWGLSYSPTSPFWVSSNGMDLATLYSVSPATQATSKVGLTVTVPVGGVTGQVFNSASSGGAFNGDNFLFVGEGGAIAGWRNALGTTAETLKLSSAADVYKGAAFATMLSGNELSVRRQLPQRHDRRPQGRERRARSRGQVHRSGTAERLRAVQHPDPRRHDLRDLRAAGRGQARRAQPAPAAASSAASTCRATSSPASLLEVRSTRRGASRSRRRRSARSPGRSWSATSATAGSAPTTRTAMPSSASSRRSTARRSRSTASGRLRPATTATPAVRRCSTSRRALTTSRTASSACSRRRSLRCPSRRRC